MKKAILFLALATILLASCVQPSYQKTVRYILHTDQVKDIKSVGIRGGDKPLNWQSDTALTPVKTDSTYQLTVTYLTGYKFTEAKFVINGNFELAEAGNRRIEFSEGDTTVYEAVFDVGK